VERKAVVEVCMAIYYGGSSQALMEFANKALAREENHEGFEFASVSGALKGEMDEYAGTTVFAAFQHAYAGMIPDMGKIMQIIASLPQGDANIGWLVSAAGDIVVANTMHVAMIKHDQLAWVTGRVSWDGIRLDSLSETQVLGQWNALYPEDDPWMPLRIALNDGRLIEGQNID
jgi:hypothetical protein